MEINRVYLGDCIKTMKKFHTNSVDLIFADPPFNIGIKYDKYNDNLSYDEYYKWSENWIQETYRVLKKNGSIYIVIEKERIENHPCQMPEDLLELIIKTSSNNGDLVLDPFGGTGTTAAVAKKLKRNFITMEISSEYYKVILKRLDGRVSEIRKNNKDKLEKQKMLFDIV